mgnify:FL=1
MPSNLGESHTAQSLERSRRSFLSAAAACGVSTLLGAGRAFSTDSLPPVRTITRGPKHHWFGYYDKLEFDPTGRYVLGMEVDFEHRSPTAADVIRVGMVDLHDGDRWIELGTSTAWCWQQGCMLQWVPGSTSTVLWNDREDGQYVCRILNVESGKRRTIPHPIYSLSPDGRTAVSTDFRRLGVCRPGYGYNGIPDPHEGVAAPDDTGILRVDLQTGRQELIVNMREVAASGPQLPGMADSPRHWFNHLLWNPDGSRFVFLHRWQVGRSRQTRMITANPDGSERRVIDANGLTSHFIWRDPQHILAFSEQPSHGKRFYLFEDADDGAIDVVGPDSMVRDAHCSYLPGNEWILNDTYPDADRMQNPYLYHVAEDRIVSLGRFRSPPEYTGEWRCDTHPRFSPDGSKVVIDSPHPGEGRQLHLIDIAEIVAG